MSWMRKQLLIMKFSAILVLIGTLQVSASTFSQQKVNVATKNASLKEVLKEIRKQSGIDFIYQDEEINHVNSLTINATDINVEELLEMCLKGTGLEHQIIDNIIVIKTGSIKQKDAFQQDVVVKGKVVDETGAPIPGVNIVLVENSTGTVTNLEGSYEIRIPEGKGTLVFSFIGFEKKEVMVDGQTELNIELKSEVSELDDVVVTGMFVRKADTYTGSARMVSSDELLKLGNRNLLTSLRNFDPSFNIVENNLYGGDPNRLPDIEIRGNSSLPNVDDLKDETRSQLNTPLIIIDGFESTLRKLMDLDETEVESITLLKDASATAIYGSRAANGVVVIATKTPVAGKLTVTYRGEMKVNAPDLTSYDVLDAREKLELEQKVGLYSREQPIMDLQLKNYYNYLLNEVNSGVNTYWLSKPLRTGIGQRHSVRLEGGDSKFRYSGSVQYNQTKGVMKESGREVLNGAINLSYSYKKIRFTNNLMVGMTRGDESPYGSFDTYVKLNPYWRSHDENGNVIKNLGSPGPGINYSPRWSSLPLNPLYNATLHQFDYNTSMEVTENMSLIWDVIEGLKLTGRLGFSKAITQSHDFKPADHTDFANMKGEDYFRKGSYGYGVDNEIKYNARLNLFYNKQFVDRHLLSVGLDLSANNNEYSNFSVLGEGFSNSSMDYFPAAMQYEKNGKPGGSESLSRNVGLTSFVNYSLDNTYFAEVSYRIDGSSQFGKENRYAPFWSTGLGWNLHNTELIKSANFIDRLKLRGSVGVTGSQNFNPYQALSTYRYNTDDKYYDLSGSNLLALGNEELRWQQTMQYNLGFDLQMLKNRVVFDFDYYIKTTDGMISSVNIPLTNGFSSYVDNIGRVDNKGVELRATGYLIRNTQSGLIWSVTGTGVHNVSEIVELSQAVKEAQEAMEAETTSSSSRFYREGESTKTIYAVRSMGIDPTNGKEVYLDRFGNATYEWNGLDQVAVGSTEPWLRGNINSAIRYKNLNVNVSFGYHFGGQQYNQTLIDKVENADFQYNVDSRVYDNRWQQPGDQAQFKGLMVTSPTYNSTRFIQDDNMFRCQNINIAYELRSKYLNETLGLRVVTFKADVADIFYTSTIKRERGTAYPFDRQFSFGVSAIF